MGSYVTCSALTQGRRAWPTGSTGGIQGLAAQSGLFLTTRALPYFPELEGFRLGPLRPCRGKAES